MSIYLGLGSNLGDRAGNLAAAVSALDSPPRMAVKSLSGVYETEPVGVEDQGRFLNMAVELETDLEPHALLRRIKALESELGRTATCRWGPRVIDIDILVFGDRVVRSEELTIPHPELGNRLFALAPLEELAGGELPIPGLGRIGPLRAEAEKKQAGACVRLGKLLD